MGKAPRIGVTHYVTWKRQNDDASLFLSGNFDLVRIIHDRFCLPVAAGGLQSRAFWREARGDDEPS
jgi:hypothetical protein